MTAFKSQFLKVFESMAVAWVWLFLVVIHIGFFSEGVPEGTTYEVFDKLIFMSCFLIYSHANEAYQSLWPFFFQFMFWWLFGAAMMWIYRKLSARNL